MYGKLEFLQFDKDDGIHHELRLNREFYHLICPVLRAAIIENALHWYVVKKYVSTVTCAERSKDENNAVGGYPLSGHLKRTNDVVYAVDLRNRDMDLTNEYMGRLQIHYHRSGIYVLNEANHLHVGILRAFQGGSIA